MADTLLMVAETNGLTFPFVSGGDTTDYTTLIGGATSDTTESIMQYLFHTAGNISKTIVRVKNNDLNASATMTLRINATNGNISITIPSGTTGDFAENDGISDTIAAGDKVCYRFNTAGSAGQIEYTIQRSIFSPESQGDTITHNAIHTFGGVDTFSTASTTWYNALCGNGYNTVTTESNAEARHRRSGTYKNLVISTESNTRTTATTVRLRVNNANSALSISIGAGLSGFFSDTTNEETIAINDDVNYSLTTGTGAGDLVTNTWQVDFFGNDYIGLYIAGDASGSARAQGTTRYWPVAGHLGSNPDESDLTIDSGLIQVDWLELTCNVSQNNVDNATTVRVRNNSTDVDPSVSIPANTTGMFSDASDILTSSYPTDDINLKIVVGAGVGGDTCTLNSTVIHAYIIPFVREEHLSMSAANPVFEDYHDVSKQSAFFGNFDSPMFGD